MKLKLPNKEDVAIDMAPMIDMVFLLLIFFMVASVVTELDKVKVALPKAKHANVPSEIKGRLILSVDANDQIYIGLRSVKIDELKKILAEELKLNENLRVDIRADERTHYKACKAIMNACGEVGVYNLIYAAYQK